MKLTTLWREKIHFLACEWESQTKVSLQNQKKKVLHLASKQKKKQKRLTTWQCPFKNDGQSNHGSRANHGTSSGSSFSMACTTSVSMLESGKTQERESKGQTTIFFHAASLTHSLQGGGFQSCTCADGHWLVGGNSGCLFLKIEKKKTPSEWVVIHVCR